MIKKEIPYTKLKDAIRVSFAEDKSIYDFFDPNVEVKNLEEIVTNILYKITTYNNATYFGIYDKEKLIGYFVYREKQLISFALTSEYRQRKYLREFFKLIREEIRGHFMTLLWNKNVRAIKYLQKQGMEIININQQITQLAY